MFKFLIARFFLPLFLHLVFKLRRNIKVFLKVLNLGTLKRVAFRRKYSKLKANVNLVTKYKQNFLYFCNSI